MKAQINFHTNGMNSLFLFIGIVGGGVHTGNEELPHLLFDLHFREDKTSGHVACIKLGEINTKQVSAIRNETS
jgi:hypothetical protein